MAEFDSIKALVKLLDDPDESVYDHVHDELVSKGLKVIPLLEDSWENDDYGLLFQTRIENLIHEIQFNATKEALKNWIQSSEKDLLEGALIIAGYQYPNLHDETVKEKIQKIRKDIWLELNDSQTAYEKVRIFNKIFYGKYHFSGNSKSFHSPMNSFINTVMETHKGNPLSLCIVYSIIAQSLDMPIYGVNLPNHFILAYMDRNRVGALSGTSNDYGVLFYINAFSKGGIFDDNEIKEFLRGLNKPESPEYFSPCSNSDMIIRMLTNLIASFQQSGSSKKVSELTELRSLFDLKF